MTHMCHQRLLEDREKALKVEAKLQKEFDEKVRLARGRRDISSGASAESTTDSATAI